MLTLPLFISLTLLVSIQKISFARDTISSTQFLNDGDTIVSGCGIFEMGFFSPTDSQNRYVGIWYKQIPILTVVWVANRDTPLTNTSSVALKIISPGWLALVDGNGADIWHTSNTSRLVPNPVAKLLDSGNLMVIDTSDGNPENFLWQSFDHPTDTIIEEYYLIGQNASTLSMELLEGFLYLRQDSRLRIIHMDLKASNILLDIDMNPKISDFGLAKNIGLNEIGANTSRIAGTKGYMSPEYARHGIFSIKSDVFSFGVLVLEIVSGKRNRGFSHYQDHYENLLGHIGGKNKTELHFICNIYLYKTRENLCTNKKGTG